MKQFKLAASDLRELATGHGGCVATDRITVDGLPVLYMSREPPSHEMDSGWLFLSGTEDDAYLDDASNLAVYDVNTIANFDPTIIPLLDAPFGAEYRREDAHSPFTLVDEE